MLPLFREEAVAHATARLEGKVLLPSRLSAWLIGGVLTGALAIGGWFAATASYARTETARGWLAPSGDELVAELFVPSRAVGLVGTGQTVELKYDAFPSQRFGRHEATVDKVSLTVLSGGEAGVAGLGISEPVFKARGRLAVQTVQADGAAVPLRAGMLLSAAIVIDRRTLADRLFEPSYAVGRQ